MEDVVVFFCSRKIGNLIYFSYFVTSYSGLCKIHLENLGAMCPDPWYSTYHYSHPPLVERLSAMMKLDKKTK